MNFIRYPPILLLIILHARADDADPDFKINSIGLRDPNPINIELDLIHIEADCSSNCNAPNIDPITVKGELHAFLTGLLDTPIQPVVMDLNTIITNVERHASKLTHTPQADISAFCNNLSKPVSTAFDQIQDSIFNFMSAKHSSIDSVVDDFVDYLNALKWTIDALSESVDYNRQGHIKSSSIRVIENGSLKVAFALINFMHSTLKLIDMASTLENSGKMIGTVLVECIGVLRLTFESIDFVNEAVQFIFQQSSKILKTAHSMIFDLFSSLIGSAHDLSRIFDDIFPSDYFDQLRSKFNESISLYSTRYRRLFASVDDILELVTKTFAIYGEQRDQLTKLFASFTVDNATTQFKEIVCFLNSIFGTLDFALSTLIYRVPDDLLSKANILLRNMQDLKRVFRSFTKSLEPPLTESRIKSIEVVGGELVASFEAIQSDAYIFQISTTSTISDLMAEFVMTLGLLIRSISEMFYVVSIGGNIMIQMFTDIKSEMLESFVVGKEYAILATAIIDVTKLIPALYTGSSDGILVVLKKIQKNVDKSFNMIWSVLSDEASQVPETIIPMLNKAKDGVRTVQSGTLILLTTTISLSESSIDNVGAIEKEAIQLGADIESFTNAMSELIQGNVIGITSINGAFVTWLLRESLTAVLIIIYYISCSIERFVAAVTGTENVILLNIAKAFLAALTQTTVQIQDVSKLGSGNVMDFKLIGGHAQDTMAKSVDTLKSSLDPIIKPDNPRKKHFVEEDEDSFEIAYREFIL